MINHKRVSRKHLVISVGEYSEEDVVCDSSNVHVPPAVHNAFHAATIQENPDAVPSLIVHSLASNRAVHRGGSELSVNAGSSMTLRDGDRLEVVHSVEIT